MNKLEQILSDAFQSAYMREKVPQKRKLKNGLHVTITSHSQGVTLELSRDQVYPSMSEWITVCNNFPYFVGRQKPHKTTGADGRLALVGELPTRRNIAEQMKFA